MDATPLPADAPASAAGEDNRVTPLMEQYVEIKAANPNCLLFYRMGISTSCSSTMRRRRAARSASCSPSAASIAARTSPCAACRSSVPTNICTGSSRSATGSRCASRPRIPPRRRKRGGKSIVRRDVVRLVTPGTLTEDFLLDARRNNYLVAIARAKLSADGDNAFALAFLDISTGEFRLTACDRNGLPAEARPPRARRDHRAPMRSTATPSWRRLLRKRSPQ